MKNHFFILTIVALLGVTIVVSYAMEDAQQDNENHYYFAITTINNTTNRDLVLTGNERILAEIPAGGMIEKTILLPQEFITNQVLIQTPNPLIRDTRGAFVAELKAFRRIHAGKITTRIDLYTKKNERQPSAFWQKESSLLNSDGHETYDIALDLVEKGGIILPANKDLKVYTTIE